MRNQNKKQTKKSELRLLLRQAELTFLATFLWDQVQTFLEIGQRSEELLSELRTIEKSLSQIDEESIKPVERRRMRRQFKRIIEFSEALISRSFDVETLNDLHLRLETEFASIKPTAGVLESIANYRVDGGVRG